MKTKIMRFLINPRGQPADKMATKKTRVRKKGGAKAAPRRAVSRHAKKRRTKYNSAAWMAKIRPKRKAAAATGGGTMARKRRKSTRRPATGAVRKRRRGASSRAVVRRAAPVKRRKSPRLHRVRSYMRNPRGHVPVVSFIMDAGIGAAEVLTGKVIARKVRGLAGLKPGSVMGSGVEALVGLIAGYGVATFINREAGERIAIGGILAPMETLVQRAGIPHISDSLGDDAFQLSGDLGYIVAEDRDALQGGRDAALGDDDGLGGYIGGGSVNDAGGALGSYIGEAA
jgi:hypothetical protein